MHEASGSADSVMRMIVSRREVLAREVTRLSDALVTYASRSAAPTVLPVISALEHYSMLDTEDCGCVTCRGWSIRREEFIDASSLIPKGHKWSTCSCRLCRFVGRIHLNFLASSNRRDLLIETSFHAKYHSPFGEQVMLWLEEELKKPVYSLNWLAQEMNRYAQEWWLRKCEMALGPIVSGKVFRDSMMVIDWVERSSSSLDMENSLIYG